MSGEPRSGIRTSLRLPLRSAALRKDGHERARIVASPDSETTEAVSYAARLATADPPVEHPRRTVARRFATRTEGRNLRLEERP